jgi:hypothetical protein
MIVWSLLPLQWIWNSSCGSAGGLRPRPRPHGLPNPPAAQAVHQQGQHRGDILPITVILLVHPSLP